MPERDAGRSQRDRSRPDADAARARQQAQARQQAAARQQAERVRDDASHRALAEKIRTMEDRHPQWCHAFREHVQATDGQLALRAEKGINARGQQGDPVDATRWQDPRSLGRAVTRLRDCDEFSRAKDRAEVQLRANPDGPARFAVRGRLEDVIGPDWRQHVYGRSLDSGGRQPCHWGSDSRAVAVWKKQDDGRWHLLTCYPEVVSHSSGRPAAGVQTI